jgi:threonine/homoserine/homoserine lactone efflux protein
MNIPIESLLRGYLLGILLAAPLGPASVAVIQTGLRSGFWRAFGTGLGIILADTTYLLLVYFGLSRFTSITWVRVLIWVFGALVLIYLGVQGVRGFWQSSSSDPFSAIGVQQSEAGDQPMTDNGQQTTDDGLQAISDGILKTDPGSRATPATRRLLHTPPADARSPLLVGYLINISNPMAAVWWLGIYGAMVGAAEASGAAQLSALAGGMAILLGILTWHFSMALLTHWGGRLLNPRSLRYVSLIAGLALIFFGLRFAWFALAEVVY